MEDDQISSKRSLWEAYLYEDHPREQLSRWARHLTYFRFCRAHGGHAGDGETLLVKLRVEDEAALQRIFEALTIPLTKVGPGEETLEPGRKYTSETMIDVATIRFMLNRLTCS